jgi:hypothetical protein
VAARASLAQSEGSDTPHKLEMTVLGFLPVGYWDGTQAEDDGPSSVSTFSIGALGYN